MTIVVSSPTAGLCGRVRVPPDKSISHRALIFGALAEGTTAIHGLLRSDDVEATSRCLGALGVRIEDRSSGQERSSVYVHGSPQLTGEGLVLDCGNSGTTMRLLLGALAGQPVAVRLVGDDSLSRRPMARVAEPLKAMGAAITLSDARTAPIHLQGSAALRGQSHTLAVASAQVKSAVLLAALHADGETIIGGRIDSRDHSERLLPAFGAALSRIETASGPALKLRGRQRLQATRISIPGDFSSAAPWLVAGSIVPGSAIELPDVGINQSRLGLLRVLERMGAEIAILEAADAVEPSATLRVCARPLVATRIEAAEVPALIDELPLLCVAAAAATGVTEIRGAAELRVKESDRIAETTSALRLLGIDIDPLPDGFVIRGTGEAHPATAAGATLHPRGDHRLAMAFAVAALWTGQPTAIADADCVSVSYPGFFTELAKLGASVART